jgi:ribonuclease Z
MKIKILGCHSSTPQIDKNPTSQILFIKNHKFLIDCGEGTQVQIRKSKVSFVNIKHIFISHLHGDHFFGLPGLLSTFNLLGRKTAVHIYGPLGIKKIITEILKAGNSWTTYKIHFRELNLNKSEIIFNDSKVKVSTIPLKHRIYTNGFLFEEKTGHRILNIKKINELKINKYFYLDLKNGKDIITENGNKVHNSELTFNAPKIKKYAYCTDTIYFEEIINIIKGVDILYHESTFLETHSEIAKKTLHSTALDAAKIAKKSEVKKLVLGHYSSRYKNKKAFYDEAVKTFPNIVLSFDGAEII